MVDFGYLLPTRGSVLSSETPETLSAKANADIIGLAGRAEALGYASVWVGDSVLARPRFEPLTTLAAVGAATSSVDLGTAVYLPFLRHPIHVAHLTATVDQITGGRLTLGIGVGSKQPDVESEAANLGVPIEQRGPRTDAILEALTELWSGRPCNFDGPFYQFQNASIGFRPVRKPPVYLPTGSYDPQRGLPAGLESRIVRFADGCLPNAISPDRYGQSLQHINSLLRDAGRTMASFDRGLYLDVVINEDESTAITDAQEFYSRYYAGRSVPSEEQIKERGAFGPPAHVLETIEAYIAAGAETIVVRFATQAQRANLRDFADIIRPLD